MKEQSSREEAIHLDGTTHNLGLATSKGVAWVGSSALATNITRFVIVAVLANLLSPHEFGLISTANIFIVFIEDLTDLGLTPAIVRRKELDLGLLSTGFWLNLVASAILILVAILMAPVVSLLFNNPNITPVFTALSFTFVLRSLSSIHRALLQRRLQFREIAAAEIGGTVIFGLVAILLAAASTGIWSLVFATLIQRLSSTIILWIVCRWHPAWKIERKYFRELFTFGGNIMGERIMTYLTLNIDYILIGHFLGTDALGIYTLAYEITYFPASKISGMASKVMFPAYSLLQDSHLMAPAYTKTMTYLSVINFPLLLGLFAVAPEFVQVAYGSQWLPMIVPLQLLCLSGILASLLQLSGSILYAKGRPDISFKWSILTFVVLTTGIAIGLSGGLVGVATASVVSWLLLYPLMQSVVLRLAQVNLRSFGSALKPAILSSSVMLMLLLVLKPSLALALDSSHIATLLSSIALGGLVYAISLRVTGHQIFTEIRQFIAR